MELHILLIQFRVSIQVKEGKHLNISMGGGGGTCIGRYGMHATFLHMPARTTDGSKRPAPSPRWLAPTQAAWGVVFVRRVSAVSEGFAASRKQFVVLSLVFIQHAVGVFCWGEVVGMRIQRVVCGIGS